MTDDRTPSTGKPGNPGKPGKKSRTPDDAYDRLRAADPAQGLEPDGARLDAAVAARTSRPYTPAVPVAVGADSDETVEVSEYAEVRTLRRPNRWMQVAAVAVGALVVGGTGFVLGNADDGSTGQQTAEAPISLGQGRDSVAGSGEAAAADSARSSYPAYGGHLVFTASGLSGDGGSTAGYAFDPAAVFNEETIARAAAAVGLEGTPKLVDGSWVIGTQDGTSASMQLSPDGLASITFYDPTIDPYACAAPDKEVLPQDSGSGSDGGTAEGSVTDSVEPVPACTPQATGTAPQGADAEAQASALLTALGLDPASFEFDDAGNTDEATATWLTAYQVLDGQRTGVSWSFTLVADGVQSFYGSLAPVVSLGDYDVVSPQEAVARLGDPRFGPSGWGGPMPLADTIISAREGAPTPGTLPDTPSAGSAFGWPVTEVTITKARLGVALQTQPDGSAVLIPSYELSSSDGQMWSVVAVVDGQLDFSPVG